VTVTLVGCPWAGDEGLNAIALTCVTVTATPADARATLNTSYAVATSV
jgi:hypothetical protein